MRKMKKLTLSQLKQFKGFETMDDRIALAIIDTLFQFSIIAFNFFHLTNIKQGGEYRYN